MVVAYAAGGTGDIVARSVADKLGTTLGQSVVVENRAGASGAIGAHSVATAAPDGYTLLVGQTGEMAVNQHWLKGLNYDPDKDLVPIALAAVVPLALVVPAKAPYSTMPEFLSALKAKPKMNFASAGIGTPGHFAGELLKLQFDENLAHVPYKGAGPALNDFIHSVATAAPDGYTLLVGQTGEMAVNQHWLKGLNYDPDKDLVPIALAAVVPLALVVPAKAPYSTMSEFLSALKAKPKMTFASAGIGTPGHFAGELLKLQFDENLAHVPYKGAGPALNDLIGNHVDFYFPGFPAAAPHVKAGTLKILALSSATRSPAAPDIPTVAELTGNKDYDFTLWAGFFAPRATPQAIIDRLNKEINRVIQDPDVKARLEAAGAVVTAMSVGQFKDFVQNESAKYLRVIKQTGVTAQ